MEWRNWQTQSVVGRINLVVRLHPPQPVDKELFMKTLITGSRDHNGSIFTFINDCICDIRFVYGKINDKLQFIVSKES